MTNAILLLVVPTTVVLALAVDIAAVVGWMRRRWRGDWNFLPSSINLPMRAARWLENV